MRQSSKRPNLQKRLEVNQKLVSRDSIATHNLHTTSNYVQQSDRTVESILRKYLPTIAVIILAMVVAGFQHFVLTLPRANTDRLQFTDGIVVMTGGQQRLDDGLRLLTEGLADKMLISGVGKGVNRAILVQELGLSETQINMLFCCVELDHAAQDTFGNAKSTNAWSRKHDMRSLRLVTANYHMPRTLMIFSRELPNVDLYQWPVNPHDLDLANWWKNPVSLRLLAREYAKYLAVHFSI